MNTAENVNLFASGPQPAATLQKKRCSPLERWSTAVTRWVGSSAAFGFAVLIVLAWAISGPALGFSEIWQLVINTGTTIITFLMVFLIQRAQAKDSKAVQLKLNELVSAIDGASNRLIDIESLDEDEIETMHKYYQRLVEKSAIERRLTRSHTAEEADALHLRKLRNR